MPPFVSFTKGWHSEPYAAISPTRPELSVAGKNVVVTGGGTGIGRSIAMSFAQAGAKSVSILGRRVEKLKEGVEAISGVAGAGSEILYEKADLTARTQVDAAFKAITDKVGKIDILVSNAGDFPAMGLVAEYNPDILMRGFELNVRGTMNVIQAFVPLAGPEPIFVNISTAMAHFAPARGASGYTVAKAANLKLVDYFAAENPDIHVVNVQPGWTPTELNGYHKDAPDSGKFSRSAGPSSPEETCF